MSLNSCFITPEAEVTLMFQPTQFPLHVRSQCHLVHYRPNEERVSLWVLAEKQQTPRPPSAQGKTSIQLQKCFSIILGISDTGKHNLCLSWTNVLAPEWEQTRHSVRSPYWMLTAVISIAHVGRGLKYPEPVPVLSHVVPSWLPEWKHEAKGGAKRWTRKINCLNHPQCSSEALAWWVSLMLKKTPQNEPKQKKKSQHLTYPIIFCGIVAVYSTER